MKMTLLFLLGAVCGGGAAMLPKLAHHLHGASHGDKKDAGVAGDTRAHTEERFAFTAHAAMEQVAPLFGADRERLWAPGWEPEIMYPSPVRDIQGMVFTVRHGHTKAAWVNTEFNLKEGQFQYVYVLPDILITVISLQLTPMGNETRVDVEYDRTSLSAEGDAGVHHMAEQDRKAGPEWELQVNSFLKAQKGV